MTTVKVGPKKQTQWETKVGTVLCSWAESGQVQKLLKVPNLRKCKNLHDAKGRTPLMAALSKKSAGCLKCASLLLHLRADTQAEDKTGQTALHLAAGHSQQRTVEKLLSAGAQPDAADRRGWTPLMLAAAAGDVGTVRLLLQYGADPDSRNRSRDTATDIAGTLRSAKAEPLLKQLQLGRLAKAVRLAILHNWPLPDGVNGEVVNSIHGGLTVLSMPIWYGRSREYLLELLSHQPDVNAKDIRGETPLQRAIRCNDAYAIAQLLKCSRISVKASVRSETFVTKNRRHGAAAAKPDDSEDSSDRGTSSEEEETEAADPNRPAESAAKGSRGEADARTATEATDEVEEDESSDSGPCFVGEPTALELARHGAGRQAQALLEAVQLSKSLCKAIRSNRLDQGQVVTFAPGINACYRGKTPLIVAAEMGHTRTMLVLIQFGALVDETGNFGLTPLMAAAAANQSKAVELLLNQGADLFRTDLGGKTAWGMAPRQTFTRKLLEAAKNSKHKH